MRETPEEVFAEYDLTAEEREILRCPDHRLLPLLGAALGRREEAERSVEPERAEVPERAEASEGSGEARLLPDSLMALTVVPCVVEERIVFATWLAPMQEGGDPSRLPPPAGASLPGVALTPLHAVLQISAVQSTDATGNPQVSMWASFRQCSNAVALVPPETAGNPEASPFGSPLHSPDVQAAAAAVHAAAPNDRYEKLVALTHALHGGDVR